LIDIIIKHRRILVYFPFVFYWIVLFIATSLPSNKLPEFSLSDKVLHFSAYFVYGFLLFSTIILQTRFKKIKAQRILFSIFSVMLYSIIDELHQNFIPGRSAEFWDWVADMSGGVTGIILVEIFYRFWLIKKSVIVDLEQN